MTTPTKITLGWREWVSLPALNIPSIKAKVDTGARTSALHAYFVEPFKENGIQKVRFGVHPLQDDSDTVTLCETDVLDQRSVTDSGGHREMRYVISTLVKLGGLEKNIEMTLTNRDTMKFRMLLGRTALENDFLVDAAASYSTGRPGDL